MTPAELFTQVGRALFGDLWKANIERALKIRPGRADDWSKGHGEPPPGVWLELARIIEDRREALPALKAEVLTFGSRPPPRIYECTNGRKFSVKADADGSYPDVYFQDGKGFWEVLTEGKRIIPPQATAYRLQRGQEIGHARPIVQNDCSQTQNLELESGVMGCGIQLRSKAEKDDSSIA